MDMQALNNRKLMALICTIALTAAFIPAQAGEDADVPGDDSISVGKKFAGDVPQEQTDSTAMSPGMELMDTAAGPIAFGVVYSNGAKQSGTPNWTSSYNSTYQRYEISITGENYYYLSYATLITPAGDQRYCRSSSVSGKLLVYCYDQAGNAATSRFGFTTFKPN
jgi:hypothetical protein